MTTITSTTAAASGASSAKTPPQLNYLVIYNPTLKPTTPLSEEQDEDDAIEQAHILFYTARERAVSKDRMLRQIGLAKALINFSELFTPSADGCDTVHSQKKRFVMIQPEKDFWIHASIDVACSPRINSASASKDKGKSKDPPKGTPKPPPAFEYHENSLHDEVLRAYLFRGYHQFKLQHGSFSTILRTTSHSTMEKTLERFWTVWAWQWDVESPPDLGKHLGLSLRPFTFLPSKPPASTSAILPTSDEGLDSPLERLLELVPSDSIPLILSLTPPGVLPLRTSPPYPPLALAQHLLSIIPPPRPRARSLSSSVSTIGPDKKKSSQTNPSTSKGASSSTHNNNSTSFIPNLNLNLNLNMNMNMNLGAMGMNMSGLGVVANPKKWGWSSLGFGNKSGRRTVSAASVVAPEGEDSSKGVASDAKVTDTAIANGSSEPDKVEVDNDRNEQDGETTPPSAQADSTSTPTQTPPTPEESDYHPPILAPQPVMAVNQRLLEDAMSTHEPEDNHQAGHSLSSSLAPPVLDTATVTDILTNAHIDASEDPGSLSDLDLETASLSDAPSTSERAESPESIVSTNNPTPEPPKRVFSEMWIHLDQEDQDGGEEEEVASMISSKPGSAKVQATGRRKVVYLSRDKLAFALVLPPSEAGEDGISTELDVDELAEGVHGLLGEIGDVLEKEALASEQALTGRLSDSNKAQPNEGDQSASRTSTLSLPSSSTRWVTRFSYGDVGWDEVPLTTNSAGFETASPHYFGLRRMLLSSHPSILEVISRAQNLRWFAGKRGVTLDKAWAGREGDSSGEIYVEVGRKDASLVDVDYEVDKIVVASRR